MILKVTVSSSSEKPLVVPPSPSVILSTSGRDLLVVATSVWMVVAWLKILSEGAVVSRVRGEVEVVLRVVDGVTVLEVGGSAVVVGGGVFVGGGCNVVVVVVVVAARTVGGKGVSFLVGGGIVGVGGLNLTME